MSFSYQSINFPKTLPKKLYQNFIKKIRTTKLTVLVVGSTRMLGSKIVAAVLDKGTVEVKAMVRSSNDSHEEKHQKIDEMKANSAGIVEGDLMKAETLRRVCQEVDIFVSAVSNNEVTVLGQKNLIDATKQQGVKRFIPSDYSLDDRKLSLERQGQPGYAEAGV
jgi:NAD(P)-dependent dehydrogenase (short-subunit alcohol dehydrogenase family)